MKEIDPLLIERVGNALSAVEKSLAGTMDNIMRATKCCPNCQHFTIDEECKLATPRARPPAKIIAFGCDGYKEGVPF